MRHLLSLILLITVALSLGCGYYGSSRKETPPATYYAPDDTYRNESYGEISENEFHDARNHPLSTFAIDVDPASYANVRRFINDGLLPPADAVRTEELINYFSYDYPQPADDDPFSIVTEIASCPWNDRNYLLHVGLQARQVDLEDLPPSNLVFLIDVSGSMNTAAKLPLLKSALHLLIDNLRPQDRVAVVVYAGAAGLVLPSTPGSRKETIRQAIDRLNAGGSTAGGAGLRLAYEVAREYFSERGNNRIILATDGDFNVGESSDQAMIELVEKNRDDGISLSVLGFGTGNLKDSKMEQMADHGNGNYAYIDNLTEARKVLVSEMGGTLFTIAKDVKIQIEFNPARVESYRLIGYENRLLAKEDFNNDRKDAGEMGAGHSVTALYEIVPAKGYARAGRVDPLRYQQTDAEPELPYADEWATVKVRYKPPTDAESRLALVRVTGDAAEIRGTTPDFRFAAAVAEWGLLLRNSEHKADASFAQVAGLARDARGDDPEGYRAEFIRLVETSASLAGRRANR